ncbi:hypothetical protein SPHINGO391_490277 [Sphingomonas aurantiaca]|uniref:Uncharacterized protein n=1 Tax=Sphingomonas aurantiaca TaxID=185949 RepID=A0A5E8A827_9SPHN|nr:hypothetical protein SPHINGO391_490277 [Sphingomonas aurantiaca]
MAAFLCGQWRLPDRAQPAVAGGARRRARRLCPQSARWRRADRDRGCHCAAGEGGSPVRDLDQDPARYDGSVGHWSCPAARGAARRVGDRAQDRDGAGSRPAQRRVQRCWAADRAGWASLRDRGDDRRHDPADAGAAEANPECGGRGGELCGDYAAVELSLPLEPGH